MLTVHNAVVIYYYRQYILDKRKKRKTDIYNGLVEKAESRLVR